MSIHIPSLRDGRLRCMPRFLFLMNSTTRYSLMALIFVICLSACAKRSSSIVSINDQQTSTYPSAINQKSPPLVNINTATSKELETLPAIGKGLAERIIEHREKYGPFRRSEHLILVRGISERRFLALRDLIIAE